MHAAGSVARKFRGRARNPGSAEILNTLDEAGVQHFECALDEQLLHERIAHLHRWALRGTIGVKRFGREDGDPADAITAGGCAVEDDAIADSTRLCEMEICMLHGADAQCIHERVPEVTRIEDDFTADVREAKAVAVSANAGNHARQHASRVRGIERPEPQWIHHRNRSSAHRDDVADDATHTGCRALIRLDVRGMIVRFDLERDCPTVTDVDHTGVLSDTHEQRIGFRLLVTELSEVDLARLVGAVF